MDSQLINLIVCALAVNYMIEAWRHGSIFAVQRARWQARDDKLAELVNCAFCLSAYVAAAVVLAFLFLLPHPISINDDVTARWMAARQVFAFVLWLFRYVVWALAAARLANLINDLTYRWCRTPNRGLGDEDGDENKGNEPE